jgi:hypothetical protein
VAGWDMLVKSALDAEKGTKLPTAAGYVYVFLKIRFVDIRNENFDFLDFVDF